MLFWKRLTTGWDLKPMQCHSTFWTFKFDVFVWSCNTARFLHVKQIVVSKKLPTGDIKRLMDQASSLLCSAFPAQLLIKVQKRSWTSLSPSLWPICHWQDTAHLLNSGEKDCLSYPKGYNTYPKYCNAYPKYCNEQVQVTLNQCALNILNEKISAYISLSFFAAHLKLWW